MLENHIHNLLIQLTQESKSLWRIRNEYKKDAGSCEKCRQLWKKMEKNKADHVKEISGMLKKHLR